VPQKRPEGFESQRSPLFLFVLPFALGILASQILPLTGTVVATLVGALVLLLLIAFPTPRDFRPWHVAFLVTVTCLGGIYGARLIPPAGSIVQVHPKAVREESIQIDPVQTFVSPPYSEDQVGLATARNQEGLVYYQAPRGSETHALPSGFWIELFGVIQPVEEFVTDPGFLQYLINRGATVGIDSLRPGRILTVDSIPRATFSLLLQKSKTALSTGSSPLESSTRVYQALVLGQRTGLSAAQKKAFRDTGTAHLFAISGLHVGLVGTLLFFLFGRIRVRQAIQVICTLSVLLFYVLLTGSTPSAVRAFLMIAFFVGAKAFDRAYCPTSALAASALFVLLLDPAQITTLGFQLSYIVVLSILVFGVPLSKTFLDATDPEYWLPGQSGSLFHRTRKWVFASLSISLAAFLGSSVLIVEHFQILPLSSILLNLVLIVPATGVLYLGFLSLFFGLLGMPWLSAPLNALARLVIDGMTAMVSTTAEVPYSSIPLTFSHSWVGPLGIFLFLCTAFWTANRPSFRIRYLLLPATSLVLTILLGTIPQM
tara:strand:- start:11698 stop:13323 length:1626 start_codon:yes stop_codon:yes gene_type:complete